MFSQCTAESRQFAKEETSAGQHVQRRKTLLVVSRDQGYSGRTEASTQAWHSHCL